MLQSFHLYEKKNHKIHSKILEQIFSNISEIYLQEVFDDP